MTDNISRMYELAKIEATTIGCTNEDIQSPDYYSNDCEGDCIDCTWYDEDEVYPPFTDTKQLELIKWLIEENKYISITTCPDGLFIIGGFSRKGINQDFSQALASLVCELWKDLTSEQREEVRGLLQ